VSFADEVNLVDIVELVVNEKLRLVADWFKHFEDVSHEVVVFLVLPIIVAVSSMVASILNLKVVLEFL
jgi:hypothetical protein